MTTKLTKTEIETAATAYPQEFYQAENSVHVSENVKKELIKKALESLNENPDSNSTVVSTGNTFVLVSRIHDEDGGGFEVNVATNYEKYNIKNDFL